MSDQTPPKRDEDTHVAESQRVTTEHLRRVAENCRDLDDPTLTAKAWDEPAPSDVPQATSPAWRFGRLQNCSRPESFDDALPEAEIAVQEGDSPSQHRGGPSG